MLLVNTQMRELFSQNRGRGGRILCVKRIHFLFVENVCVGEYIFFSLLAVESRFLKKQVFEQASLL
jgi:DNA phosphorothioation-dependent restriction protein DptG